MYFKKTTRVQQVEASLALDYTLKNVVNAAWAFGSFRLLLVFFLNDVTLVVNMSDAWSVGLRVPVVEGY